MVSEMHGNMWAHTMESLKVADIVEMLREQPSTRDLSAQHIHAMADCAHARTLAAREYLWRQGQQSVALYLIQSGHVALEISVPGQGPLCIDIVHEGEILGYSSLMGSSRNQFDARALTPVSCIAIQWEHLHRLMERDQKLGYALLKRMAPMMARKLESAQLRLLDVNGLEGLRT
jgi:CRP/FNR family cyclic AMP-dependent transcriptional regulator